jgi:transcriptional regulator with XRE-family HTH domain
MAREQFTEWLQERVNQAGGIRPAAQRAGVSHATILRGLEGGSLSLTSLEGIARWTNVGLVRLLRLYGADIEDDHNRTEAALARVLDEYPQLRQTLDVAIDVLDDEALAEIISFIEFQAQKKRRS